MKLSGLLVVAITVSTAASFQTVVQQQHRHNKKEFLSTQLGVGAAPPMMETWVNIEEGFPRDIGTMDQWAAACGVQKADGFQLTMADDGLDCSVVTTQDIAANQPVLHVPSDLILTGTKAQMELGVVPAAENMLEQMHAKDHIPQFYIFLKILKEWELGDRSPWFPWLNSLPRYFSNGSSMTHFCTDCLPPLVAKLTNNERMRFIQFFRSLNYVDGLYAETKANRALATWVYAVVYTRSFPTGDGDAYIVPMADMFNHGTEVELAMNFDEGGNACAYTTYDVPAGSPLRLSYGDPTNPSFLFARFGFVDDSSPATFCKIMRDKPSQELLDLGYDHSKMLFYKDTGEVSQEVWDVLLYEHLGKRHRSEQRQFHKAHMTGDNEIKQALHEKHFDATLTDLSAHVDAFLQTLDELSIKALSGDPSQHPRLPLLLRHNEFVKTTFLNVKARLEQTM